MRFWITATVMVLTCTTASAQRQIVCPQEYLDLPAINEIGRSSSCQAIDAAFRRVVAPDAVTKLVYAAHRARHCRGSESNRLLIQSLPSDAITFTLLYSLTYPSDVVPIIKSVDELAGGMWLDLALEAVIKEGRGGRAFLMQSYLGSNNADIGEMFADLQAEFQRRAPKNFAAALQLLPKAAKERIYVEQ